MKILLISFLALVISSASASLSFSLLPGNGDRVLLESIAKGVASKLAQTLVSPPVLKEIIQYGSHSVPLLPLVPGYPFDASFETHNDGFYFELLDTEDAKITLDLTFINSTTTLNHLNTLSDLLTVKFLPAGNTVANWNLVLPQFEAFGDYYLYLRVFDKKDITNDVYTLIEAANADLSFANFALGIFMDLKIQPFQEKIRLNQFRLDLTPPQGLRNWALWTHEEVKYDGTQTEVIKGEGDIGSFWDMIIGILIPMLDPLIEDVTCAVDYVVNDCTFMELSKEGFACLKNVTDSGCFTDEPDVSTTTGDVNPTTSDPEVPPTTSDPEVPPTTADPEVPPTTSDPEVPPTTSDPEVPPTTGDPEVPPTTSDPEVPPTTSDPEVPPTTSDPEVPPTTSDPDVPPTTSDPEEPSTTSDPELTTTTPAPTTTTTIVPSTTTTTTMPPTSSTTTTVPPTSTTTTAVPSTSTSTTTVPPTTSTTTTTTTTTTSPDPITSTSTTTTTPVTTTTSTTDPATSSSTITTTTTTTSEPPTSTTVEASTSSSSNLVSTTVYTLLVTVISFKLYVA